MCLREPTVESLGKADAAEEVLEAGILAYGGHIFRN